MYYNIIIKYLRRDNSIHALATRAPPLLRKRLIKICESCFCKSPRRNTAYYRIIIFTVIHASTHTHTHIQTPQYCAHKYKSLTARRAKCFFIIIITLKHTQFFFYFGEVENCTCMSTYKTIPALYSLNPYIHYKSIRDQSFLSCLHIFR